MKRFKEVTQKKYFRMSNTLKPCPFCGGQPYIEKHELFYGSHGYHDCYMYKIVCNNENCKVNPYIEEHTIYQSEIVAIEKIIKYWNKRAK